VLVAARNRPAAPNPSCSRCGPGPAAGLGRKGPAPLPAPDRRPLWPGPQKTSPQRWSKAVFRRPGRPDPTALPRSHHRRRSRASRCRWNASFCNRTAPTFRATASNGLGSDGSVGATRTRSKIIGESHRSLRPGLLRLRLEEIRFSHRLARCASARTRSTPATWCSRPTWWPPPMGFSFFLALRSAR